MKRIEFERVTPPEVSISCESIERLLDYLESSFTEMHGIIIMRHGKICAEGWWHPYAPGLRHGLQSLSKTYTATAVGIAYTEGLLSLEDKVLPFFSPEAPSDPSTHLQDLSIRDVLRMGCGMESSPPASGHWIRNFLATPILHEPGTTFWYNNTGATLLAAIIKRKTGLCLHDYLTPRLFDKIGIDAGNLRWAHMPDGTEIGAGGLYATTEDNLRMIKLYANGGVWDGERILAEDFVAMATRKQMDTSNQREIAPLAADNHVGYGYQMWMCQPEGVYRADGALGQFAIVCPKQDIIISITETVVDVQKTLDGVWSFLDEVDGKEPQGPELAECEFLAARLKRLSMPAPRYSPFSHRISSINNQWYRVTEGLFHVEEVVSLGMGGMEMPVGIEALSFNFSSDVCTLNYRVDGKTRQLFIATNGTRYLNKAEYKNRPTGLLYLSGAWLSAKDFIVTARWIETCFEMEYIFAFEDACTLTIQANPSNGADSPFDSGLRVPARAVRI